MATPLTPFRGLRFEHARFREALPGVRIADCPPAVFVVTKITRTSVYYGPPGPRAPRKGRKASHCIDVAAFATVVGRILEGES